MIIKLKLLIKSISVIGIRGIVKVRKNLLNFFNEAILDEIISQFGINSQNVDIAGLTGKLLEMDERSGALKKRCEEEEEEDEEERDPEDDQKIVIMGEEEWDGSARIVAESGDMVEPIIYTVIEILCIVRFKLFTFFKYGTINVVFINLFN